MSRFPASGGGGSAFTYIFDGFPSGAVAGESLYHLGNGASYVYTGSVWVRESRTDGQIQNIVDGANITVGNAQQLDGQDPSVYATPTSTQNEFIPGGLKSFGDTANEVLNYGGNVIGKSITASLSNTYEPTGNADQADSVNTTAYLRLTSDFAGQDAEYTVNISIDAKDSEGTILDSYSDTRTGSLGAAANTADTTETFDTSLNTTAPRIAMVDYAMDGEIVGVDEGGSGSGGAIEIDLDFNGEANIRPLQAHGHLI